MVMSIRMMRVSRTGFELAFGSDSPLVCILNRCPESTVGILRYICDSQTGALESWAIANRSSRALNWRLQTRDSCYSVYSCYCFILTFNDSSPYTRYADQMQATLDSTGLKRIVFSFIFVAHASYAHQT